MKSAPAAAATLPPAAQIQQGRIVVPRRDRTAHHSGHERVYSQKQVSDMTIISAHFFADARHTCDEAVFFQASLPVASVWWRYRTSLSSGCPHSQCVRSRGPDAFQECASRPASRRWLCSHRSLLQQKNRQHQIV